MASKPDSCGLLGVFLTVPASLRFSHQKPLWSVRMTRAAAVMAVGLIVTCRRALKCLISALALSAGARMEVSSLGFCGGWFTWCRWLLVVVVPGGGCRVPGRLCARWGCACRWRSVAGWCPYQWTHSAVASTGGVDVLPGSLVTGSARPCIRSLSASARAKPGGVALGTHRGDCLGLG